MAIENLSGFQINSVCMGLVLTIKNMITSKEQSEPLKKEKANKHLSNVSLAAFAICLASASKSSETKLNWIKFMNPLRRRYSNKL